MHHEATETPAGRVLYTVKETLLIQMAQSRLSHSLLTGDGVVVLEDTRLLDQRHPLGEDALLEGQTIVQPQALQQEPVGEALDRKSSPGPSITR